jgi:hypothetical protein
MLLPRTIDNRYRGQKAALWILGVLALARVAMGFNVIFNGRTVAMQADGIPLDAYPTAAAQTILAMFAVWALDQLVLALASLLVLVRYRSFVPFTFLVLASEQLLRRVVLHFIPPVRSGEPPAFAINLVLLIVTLAGFGLSLWNRKDEP